MPYQFFKDEQYFIALDGGQTGLNQEAIAKLSGVHQTTIGRLVNNVRQTLSNYEPLQCFYKKTESQYLLDVFGHQNLFDSNYAFGIIAYYAEIERNSEAIKSLVSIGRIGLRAYIQHVTGFQVHLGGQTDLDSLHDRLDITAEMLRRTDHKVANLEYFRDHISDIWQHLLEFKDGKSYYQDLAVLPPQVQRNAFKYINNLKDIFWTIYKIRRDCGVSSLDQLSKDRIEIVNKTLPAALTTTRGVPGRGCDLKTWQWDKLFSLDFNMLYEETLVSTDKQGVSKFGRRKDISKIVCATAKENRLIKDEPLINTMVDRFKADYPERLDLFEINTYRSQNNLEEAYLLERLAQSDVEKGKLLERDYPRFDASYKLRHQMRTFVGLLRQFYSSEKQLYCCICAFSSWAKMIVDVAPANSLPFMPTRYLPPDQELYIHEQYRGLPYLERHHFYYPQVFDAILDAEKMLKVLADKYHIPYKNRLLMLKLFERCQLKGSHKDYRAFHNDLSAMDDCKPVIDKWCANELKSKDCFDSDFESLTR